MTCWNDPIVDEIRTGRQEHAAAFGFDVRRILEDYRQRQALSGRKIVRFPPRPPRPKVQRRVADEQPV